MKNLQFTKLFAMIFGIALIFASCGKEEQLPIDKQANIEQEDKAAYLAEKVMEAHEELAPGQFAVPAGIDVYDGKKYMNGIYELAKCPGCPVAELEPVRYEDDGPVLNTSCTLDIVITIPAGTTLYVENDGDVPFVGDFKFKGPLSIQLTITANDGDTRDFSYFGTGGVTVTSFPADAGPFAIGCTLLYIEPTPLDDLDSGEITFGCDPRG